MTKPATPPLSSLAVAAIVMTPFMPPIGFILGIVALSNINGAPIPLRGGPLARAAIVTSVLLMMIVGVATYVASRPESSSSARAAMVTRCARREQGEAKGGLLLLHANQLKYRARTGAFTADATQVSDGMRPEANFRFSVQDASSDAFTAEAVGFGVMAGELWRIGADRKLLLVTATCD